MPAALQINWPEVRRACEAGLDMHAAATRFGASYEAIRKRGQREHWITCRRLKRLVSQAVPRGQITALEAIAADWVARQAAHRNQVHKLGSRLLDAADLTPPTIQTVNDLTAIDKLMRQNLGLQNTSEGATVNVLFECGSGAFCVEGE